MGSCNNWVSNIPKSRSDEEGDIPNVGGTGRFWERIKGNKFDETRLFASTDVCPGGGEGGKGKSLHMGGWMGWVWEERGDSYHTWYAVVGSVLIRSIGLLSKLRLPTLPRVSMVGIYLSIYL